MSAGGGRGGVSSERSRSNNTGGKSKHAPEKINRGLKLARVSGGGGGAGGSGGGGGGHVNRGGGPWWC